MSDCGDQSEGFSERRESEAEVLLTAVQEIIEAEAIKIDEEVNCAHRQEIRSKRLKNIALGTGALAITALVIQYAPGAVADVAENFRFMDAFSSSFMQVR
jgi:hypothetical protein